MTELREQTPHSVIPETQARRDQRQRRLLRTYLPELIQLEHQLAESPASFCVQLLTSVAVDEVTLPIYRIDLGNDAPDKPVLLVTGGVHGLERIGSQVVMAWLQTLAARSRWDYHLSALLDKIHIIFLPIVNPGGMYLNQRANPNGVDLMRNAPIEAQGRSAFLLGGQRLSSWLPWYTGDPEQGMEPENQMLQQVIDESLAHRPFSLSLDCHSGFGWRDQIWFPYAYRRRPMRKIAAIMALKLLWEETYPNHDYVFEPQSNHYMTHGDLWDYFYKRLNRQNGGTFLPLTLELGSWRWVRKRPRQLFTLRGLFNPLVPHRHQRVLRSHLLWLDFLMDATVHFENWLPAGDQEPMLREAAMAYWYRNRQP